MQELREAPILRAAERHLEGGNIMQQNWRNSR
jgi:hypothetical protein